MESITPYLSFRGNCREVMQFYKRCIGGELDFMTYAKLPAEQQKKVSDYKEDNILHSSLSVNGKAVLMASDCGETESIDGNNIALYFECSSEQTLREQFELLSDGGVVKMPVALEFWGDLYGMLKDKYGIYWMLSYTPKPQSDSSQQND